MPKIRSTKQFVGKLVGVQSFSDDRGKLNEDGHVTHYIENGEAMWDLSRQKRMSFEEW